MPASLKMDENFNPDIHEAGMGFLDVGEGTSWIYDGIDPHRDGRVLAHSVTNPMMKSSESIEYATKWWRRNPLRDEKPFREPNSICEACKGVGIWNDAECGDISYNTYTCKECEGQGVFGALVPIRKYIRDAFGYNEASQHAKALYDIMKGEKK